MVLFLENSQGMLTYYDSRIIITMTVVVTMVVVTTEMWQQSHAAGNSLCRKSAAML